MRNPIWRKDFDNLEVISNYEEVVAKTCKSNLLNKKQQVNNTSAQQVIRSVILIVADREPNISDSSSSYGERETPNNEYNIGTESEKGERSRLEGGSSNYEDGYESL